jgi:4-diphosphocytidyl-2-C-methyl-D-erythritol kinase
VTGERERAFAKINLCLFLGAQRGDGRHEIVTLFESICLADDLVVTPLPSGHDEVVCLEVSGDNLVSQALAGLRTAGWSAPPVRVEIVKRIPVAAGLGGGSADAAAMLRCAPRLGSVPAAALGAIAARLGADVPGQLVPGPSWGAGAGERITPVDEPAEHWVLVLPQPFGLSTADVYREADRLGLARGARELESRRAELQTALGGRSSDRSLPSHLLVNDLQPAAVSLRPGIRTALELANQAGAEPALVCGSGPTVIGIFRGRNGARRAADGLSERFPGACAVDVVRRGDLESVPND